MNKNFHAIVDEVRHAKALADRRLVWPFPAEVERPGFNPKHIEQFVMCKPETGLFFSPRAALRYNANALPKSFAPKTRQCCEGASDCWRFQKAIREERGVGAIGSYTIDQDTANIDTQQFSVHMVLLANLARNVALPANRAWLRPEEFLVTRAELLFQAGRGASCPT